MWASKPKHYAERYWRRYWLQQLENIQMIPRPFCAHEQVWDQNLTLRASWLCLHLIAMTPSPPQMCCIISQGLLCSCPDLDCLCSCPGVFTDPHSDPAGLAPLRSVSAKPLRRPQPITPWSPSQPHEPTITVIHHLGYKVLHPLS